MKIGNQPIIAARLAKPSNSESDDILRTTTASNSNCKNKFQQSEIIECYCFTEQNHHLCVTYSKMQHEVAC